MHDKVEYNPLQLETAKYIEEDKNLVVMAPTSSGKTIVAEQYLFTAIEKGHRAIYLSPLKALTNEKLLGWSGLPYSKIAITSDHVRKPKAIREDLVLMTTEALDSKTRGARRWLEAVSVLVVDEAHLLTVPGRGDATEVGITRFSQLNKNARVVLLSATIPNAAELGNWLTHLNGKPTEVISTEWRPVEQEHHLIEAPDEEWYFNDKVVDTARNLRQENPDLQMLIFVHTIGKGKTFSKRLKIPFHYSKESKERRHAMEEAFRNKDLMALVSTSTLAYGINLPADIGIIAGAHRGPVMVASYDIKQMAGRIGRYGLSKKGYVYYVFRKMDLEVWDTIHTTTDIVSVLPKRLYFHLVSFIARENMQLPEISSFIDKTFAGFLHTINVDEAIETLLQYNIVKKEGSSLRAMPVGRAAALMYIDPIDLWHLKRNLQERPMTATPIAIAFAKMPSLEVPTYVPKDLPNPITMPYGQQTLVATALRDWLCGEELSQTEAVILPPYIADMERWLSALGIAGLDKNYLKSLSLMILNGVPEHLTDLVSVPFIGRKRAVSLYKHGIVSRKDLLERERISKNILGNKTFMKISAAISAEMGTPRIIY